MARVSTSAGVQAYIEMLTVVHHVHVHNDSYRLAFFHRVVPQDYVSGTKIWKRTSKLSTCSCSTNNISTDNVKCFEI